MELTIGTPALLFSIVALLMVAFTNRFVSISGLIRELHEKFQQNPHNEVITKQIKNLRQRVNLIRNMQLIAVSSLLLSVICMHIIFLDHRQLAPFIFAMSLSLLCVALVMSAWEIAISTHALNIELSDMESGV
jgi:hypothetical protein